MNNITKKEQPFIQNDQSEQLSGKTAVNRAIPQHGMEGNGIPGFGIASATYYHDAFLDRSWRINPFLFKILDGTIGLKNQAIVKDPLVHTMGDSLFGYLDIKIHNYIKDKQYKRVIVIGKYDRSKGIANNEKGGKLFNWQRPTAELIGDDLFIKCPPGHDYVQHYASIIASYLALTGQDHSCVSYIPPSEKDCWQLIETSNLKDIHPTDFVIYGFGVHQIAGTTNWVSEGPFKSTRVRVNNTDVTFLGCDFCVWGDITSRMVQYLAEVKKIQSFVYIGKLGSINPAYIPNRHLATGNTSLVAGKLVQWESVFEKIPSDDVVKKGIHYTIPSTLMETKKWSQIIRGFDFIDPEIGHMGDAAARSSIRFGYMHIISDNLVKKFPEDLSNERIKSVIKKRKVLLCKIRTLIEKVC